MPAGFALKMKDGAHAVFVIDVVITKTIKGSPADPPDERVRDLASFLAGVALPGAEKLFGANVLCADSGGGAAAALVDRLAKEARKEDP